jgi:hypothetical protein
MSHETDAAPAAPPAATNKAPADLERAEAKRLLRELRSRAPKAYDDPRYHRRSLARLLLEEGAGEQRTRSEKAGELVELALGLATAMLRSSPEDPWLLRFAATAWLLVSSLHRLDGNLALAEAALPSAACYLSAAPERAELARYLRTAGLLRWEQGRLAEAEALLAAGGRTAEAGELAVEAVVAQALLGLLEAEQGDLEPAVPRLEQAVPALAAGGVHGPLAFTAGFNLAAGLARLGQPERAREALADARSFASRLKTEEEQTRARWLEGRALLAMGEGQAALRLLSAVEMTLLRERDLPNATVAWLDRAVAETQCGLTSPIRLPERARTLFPPWDGRDVAFAAFDRLASLALEPENVLAGVEALARAVRRKLRFRGFRVEAPPYV